MKRIAARGIPQNAPRVMKKTLWSAESACNAVQNVQLVLLATEGHPREDTIERLRVLAILSTGRNCGFRDGAFVI